MQDGAAGYVLAGGQSSRMGVDKALLPFERRPLVEYAIATLRTAGIEPAIVGNRPDLAPYARIIPDGIAGRGPLQGVSRALAENQGDLAVFLNVDTPLMPSGLVSHLVLRARLTGSVVTIPSVNGYPQTFPCVLGRMAVNAIQAELEQSRRSCIAAFRAAAEQADQRADIVPVESLAQSGLIDDPAGIPASFWLLNVNAPGDLAFAERLRSSSIA